jgi:sRNA-binding protein
MSQDHRIVIAKLAELFPKAFSEDARQRRPLKANIASDIEQLGCADLIGLNVGAAVDFYMSLIGYQISLGEAGSHRIDLDGRPAAKVTVEEADAARRKAAGIRVQMDEKRMVAAPPQAASPRSRKTLIDGARAAMTEQDLVANAARRLVRLTALLEGDRDEYATDFARRVAEDVRMDINALLAKLNETVVTHPQLSVVHLPRD